ncbi:tubulin epsilon and delta complex protein 1 isoform X5 [Lutra lutra]|uniref:tubulin epsilon and delta complex protein 1 isoform X5 n=1 Tax=Lutra lutra TaxID=9657 RepID=UPI001FD2C500|nr:tubulin epsilon and delta complex protein 1 isoform X5 [Lutra lutra]
MGRRRRRGYAVGALPEAIAALSQTLPAGPSPEIFRRAKFDRPEAAPALWQLLFRVLSPPPAAGASPALGAQVRLVKSALCSQGYPRRVLAQLPEDGSQGSRELLLALAWLLARGPLLEHLLAQTRVWLGDEIPLCQIHSYTRGCHSDRSLGHLSVAEIQLLRDPEGGQQLLQRLESENTRLEAALQWRRQELVFWQWMDTVLGSCRLEASPATVLPRDPASGPGELELVAWELQGLHGELQGAAEPRRAAWEAKAGGWGPEWSTAQRAIQEAVGRDLAALQRAWEQGGAPALPHRPCRLVKRDARAVEGPGLWAAELTGALRIRESRLEAVLGRLQTRCRQELARLAGAEPGLIWILPSSR